MLLDNFPKGFALESQKCLIVNILEDGVRDGISDCVPKLRPLSDIWTNL